MGQHSTARLSMIRASSGSSSSTAAFHKRTELGTCSSAGKGHTRNPVTEEGVKAGRPDPEGAAAAGSGRLTLGDSQGGLGVLPGLGHSRQPRAVHHSHPYSPLKINVRKRHVGTRRPSSPGRDSRRWCSERDAEITRKQKGPRDKCLPRLACSRGQLSLGPRDGRTDAAACGVQGSAPTGEERLSERRW